MGKLSKVKQCIPESSRAQTVFEDTGFMTYMCIFGLERETCLNGLSQCNHHSTSCMYTLRSGCQCSHNGRFFHPNGQLFIYQASKQYFRFSCENVGNFLYHLGNFHYKKVKFINCSRLPRNARL